MSRKFAKTVAMSMLTLAIAACGENQKQPERRPLEHGGVDGCMTGLANLIPDDKMRKTACECTANAIQADRVFTGKRDDAYQKAHSERLAQCRTDAGMSETDPFGILDDDAPSSSDASKITGQPVEHKTGGGEFASDNHGTGDPEYADQ